MIYYSIIYKKLRTIPSERRNGTHSSPLTRKSKFIITRMCPGGTAVEHSTHYPKIKGSNPSTGTDREREREKMVTISSCFKTIY
jgi:hypothetical protein